jgi:hypothetical protein
MSDRPLRKGDRVTATGTVAGIADIEDGQVEIRWDNASDSWAEEVSALTLIEPPEPPVGSVVVKDGTAWIRWNTGIGAHWRNEHGDQDLWANLSDGEVIHTPGGGV